MISPAEYVATAPFILRSANSKQPQLEAYRIPISGRRVGGTLEAFAVSVGVIIRRTELASGDVLSGGAGCRSGADGSDVLHAGIARRTRFHFAGRRQSFRVLKVIAAEFGLDPFVHLLRLFALVARSSIREVV